MVSAATEAYEQARLIGPNSYVIREESGNALELDEWKALVAGSKFAQWPSYGMQRSGHIALQDHGDRVWYRNLRVRHSGLDR